MSGEVPAGHYVLAGASGLVGRHALERLAGHPGVAVTALYRSSSRFRSRPGVSPVIVDLSDPLAARQAVPRADYMLLFAGEVAPAPVLARDPVTPAINNLRICINALEAAWHAGIRKVVWLSSTTVYPDAEGDITEDMAGHGHPPGNWYAMGCGMRYGESLCHAYANHPVRPMSCIALRPTLIYGAHSSFGDDAHFLPALVRRVAERRSPVEVWGDGEQRRDVVHGADVVEAALQAIERIEGFDTFNIGGGRSFSVNEVLARLLAVDAYADAKIVHLDNKPSSVKNRSFSIEKARRMLGYAPQIGLDEGLRRTLAWFRESAAAA